MPGMAGGVLWGTIWGSLVGALVLVAAALVLELGPGADPVGTGPVATGPVMPEAATPEPAAARRAPDAGAVLLAGLVDIRPPADAGPPATLPPAVAGDLVARPEQPVMPHLVVGPDVPVPVADLPPFPVRAPAAPVIGPLTTTVRVPPPVGIGDGVSVPAPRPPARQDVSRAGNGPPLFLAAPPTDMPDMPPAPGPLIAAPATPAVAPPPVLDAMPPAVTLPDIVAARRAAPVSAALLPAVPRPQPPGPRVAFVLVAPPDTPTRDRPDWISARATAGAAGRMELASGVPVVTDHGAAAQDGLIAYARLDGVEAADATALARIALRARRDGAVTVLVAPDPALWDRIGAWLGGAARDLIPVDAASLLD